MEYNIWLGNPHRSTFQWQKLCDEVFRLFIPVIRQHRAFSGLRVRSTMATPAPLPHELLIYVVPGHAHGVVGGHFGTGTKSDDQYGQCKWNGSLTGAEVYVRRLAPEYVAKYVFHEALHAKTHFPDATLHKENGLARSPMDHAEAKLTPENIKLMRRFLRTERTPWTGGFAAVKSYG